MDDITPSNLETRRSRPEQWLAAVFMLILRVGLIAALIYVLYRVGFIIVVVLMAVMLALTVAPVVECLRQSPVLRFVPKYARRGVATTVVFLLLAVALVGTGILIVRPLAQEISALAANWRDYQVHYGRQITLFQEWYEKLPADVQSWANANVFEFLGARVPQQLERVAHRTLESGMLLVELILIPVLAFSFLTEGRPLKRELCTVLPPRYLRHGLHLLREAGTILQSYAVGQLILALIAGGVVWILMVSLGIRYALALAVVAAVTRVIPVVGPIIGGIPIVLISTLQGWDRGLFVLVAFCVMHLVESKVVMPKLIGYRIKLHPAVVIIVLLIGAEFFGMWGMFLAAPVAAVVKAVIQYFFVRPRRRRPGSGLSPRPPIRPREPELERPAVAGIRRHSGAH